YIGQQCLDRYDNTITHAMKRKDAVDTRILLSRTGPSHFGRGQLVHVYQNDPEYTFKTERKLLP
ncbi:hypothetical protein BV22DRAFT_1025299, partial [Leucogyrophana mollusca]